jgi:hypothetical protein
VTFDGQLARKREVRKEKGTRALLGSFMVI